MLRVSSFDLPSSHCSLLFPSPLTTLSQLVCRSLAGSSGVSPHPGTKIRIQVVMESRETKRDRASERGRKKKEKNTNVGLLLRPRPKNKKKLPLFSLNNHSAPPTAPPRPRPRSRPRPPPRPLSRPARRRPPTSSTSASSTSPSASASRAAATARPMSPARTRRWGTPTRTCSPGTSSCASPRPSAPTSGTRRTLAR